MNKLYYLICMPLCFVLQVVAQNNVGIGTTSPMTRLHIGGGSDASYTAQSGFLIIGNVGLTNMVFDDNEIIARNAGLSSPLYLNSNGGNIILGSSGVGNVGILTGSPAERLHIGAGNIRLDNAPLGINLNAVDRPLITRRFDAFTSGNYNGLGRWGLFMEPSTLTAGIPVSAGKGFAVSAYNANSTVYKQLLKVGLDASGTNGLTTINTDVNLIGNLTKTASTGAVNLLPIAFGRINGAGEIMDGSTNNFTVVRDGVGDYFIYINGVTNLLSLVITATPFKRTLAGGVEKHVIAVCNIHNVVLFDKDDNKVDGMFTFIAFYNNTD